MLIKTKKIFVATSESGKTLMSEIRKVIQYVINTMLVLKHQQIQLTLKKSFTQKNKIFK